MPKPTAVVRVIRTLGYHPEARDANGAEIPARDRTTVQAFAADGTPTSPVFEPADPARRDALIARHWPGVTVEHSDDRAAVRNRYRQAGYEIPE